jgi:hypothetical protein
MKGKYLFALAVITVFLAASVVPVLAGTSQSYSGKVTVIVWNRDTHRPFAGAVVYLSQGPYTTCTGKPPHLTCGGTAQTWVASPAGGNPAPLGTDAWGRVTFSIPADTYYGAFVTGQPVTVWVYAYPDGCNCFNAATCCPSYPGQCHYNTYGPYYLVGFLRTNVMYVSFSLSD